MPTYHILHSPWKTFLLQTDIAMAVTFVLASAVTGSSDLTQNFCYARRRPCLGSCFITGRIRYARIYGSGTRPHDPLYTFYYMR